MLKWFREAWCDMAHGGGRVQRDPDGRINWQCSTCGRWSVPVSLADEAVVINREVDACRRRQEAGKW